MVNKYNGPVRVRLFTLNFKRIKMLNVQREVHMCDCQAANGDPN